jgi:hypothetical protein
VPGLEAEEEGVVAELLTEDQIRTTISKAS